jgi:CBS domain-containing protein
MAAYNEIESFLLSSVGHADGTLGFRKALDSFRRRHPRRLSSQQFETLRSMADLRNFVVHEKYLNGGPLAEPSAPAAAVLEKLRDELLYPMTALAGLRRPKPVTLRPDQSVRQALALVRDEDFSQIPIYDDGTYVSLLTTNTVARWLADQMHRHDGLAEDATIAEVLQFQEEERVRHVARDVPAREVVNEYAACAAEGRPLSAVIISHSGSPSEAPLGLVVPEDLAFFEL